MLPLATPLAASPERPLLAPATDWSHRSARRLSDVLRMRARSQAAAPAFTFLENGEPIGVMSFADLDLRARAIAARLQARDATGQPVMLVLDPGLNYLAALFGCFYAGAIAVPVYPPDPFRVARLMPRLRAVFDNAGCELLVGESKELGRADSPVLKMSPRAPLLVDRVTPQAADQWEPAAAPPDSPAILQYTSGTTGVAKGVAITHDNLMHNMRALEQALDIDHAVALHWLPPYHDLGLIGGVLAPVFAGRHTVLMSPLDFMRNPAGWLRAIDRFGATTSASPNFGYELCLRKVREADCEGLDLSRWQIAASGAEPVRSDTLDRFCERFGPYGFRREAFTPAYGLAEATLFVSLKSLGETPRAMAIDGPALAEHRVEPCPQQRPGARTIVSCGPPGPEIEVRIIDPQTRAATDQVGEVWVRSPGVASGYWRRADATAETFDASTADGAPGFLRTGDYGFMREGELYVTGRKKEVLILAGRNYYPQDIEAAIQARHEGLKGDGGAVVSVEIDNEERLVVFQEVHRPRKQDLAALLELVRVTVAEEVGQEPHAVVLIAAGEVPKTSSGKLQRAACWAAYQQGLLMKLAEWTAAGEQRPEQPESAGPQYAAPQTETETWLADAWADVLGAERIGRHDHFLRLGGRSLQVIDMLQRVAQRTGVELPLAVVFEQPTLAGLASRIDGAVQSGAWRVGNPRAAEAAPAPDGAAGQSLPTTPAQHRFWLLDQLGLGPGGANVPVAVGIDGPIDTPRLQQALDCLVARHDALRARFVMEGAQLRQQLDPTARIVLEPIKAGGQTPAQAAHSELAWRPFDVTRAPLARAALTAGDRPVLLLVLHHMVCDRASATLLLQELAALYNGDPLPENEWSYAQSLALATATPCDDPRSQQSSQYWKTRLADAPAAIDLPLARPPQSDRLDQAASAVRPLDAALLRRVSELAMQESATPFLVYLSAMHLMLSRYAPDRQIGVGVALSSRLPQERSTAGCFINAAPVFADVQAGGDYRTWLRRLRDDALNDLHHARLPWEQIVAAADKPRVAGRMPVVQTFFLFDDSEVEPLRLGPQRSTAFASDYRGMAAYDVTLVVESGAHAPTVRLVYEPERMPAEAAEAMLDAYLTILQTAAGAPETPVAALQAPTGAQRDRLLALAQGPTLGGPALGGPTLGGPTLGGPALEDAADPLSRFLTHADAAPGATAVSFRGADVTYGALADQAAALAHRFERLGVRPGDRVGLFAERSPEAIAAMLGLWMTGAAYVPLDPAYPDARLRDTAADADLRLLVTDADNAPRAHTFGAPAHTLQGLLGGADPRPFAPRSLDPRRPAYVIYTSGSTGRPKGVVVPLDAVGAMLGAFGAELGVGPGDRVLAATTFGFDISVLELFLPLAAGAAVLLAPATLGVDPEGVVELARGASLVQATPSALQTMLTLGWRPRPGQRVLCGGEALPPELARVLRLATDRLWNVYGPTETTVWSTCQQIGSVGDSMPIGRPIAGTSCYVVDQRGALAPVGVWGELWIGGAGVAAGYWQRPELTAERFLADPFAPASGGRVYRTGDVARWNHQRVLEFAGRRDQQVKLRGHRIELGEVEAALVGCPEVAEAAVVVQQQSLVAFVTLAPDAAATPGDLRARLAETLPEPMIPAAIVPLDALPRNAAGKIDRAGLAARRVTGADRTRQIVAPRDPEEQLVAEVWAERLQMDQLSVHDHFFELGGHSQLAVEVMVALEQRSGVRLPLAALFGTPTIAHAAELLRNPPAADASSSLMVLSATGDAPPLFCVHPAGGTVFCYGDLAQQLEGQRPVIGLQALGVDGMHAPHESMDEMVAHYRAAIEGFCPTGPFHLCGWSLGGNVAFELARQMRAAGAEVGVVALFDSGAVPATDDVAETDLMPLIGALFPDMQHVPLEELKQMPPEALVQFFAERASRARLIDNRQLAAGGFILDVFTKNMQVFVHHRPGRYDGPVTLLRAGLQATMHAALGDGALGWDRVAADLTVIDVPSDHTQMMSRPHVDRVVEGLRASLAKWEAAHLEADG
ncbi:Tyrocidine synthase 3 [Pirellulimonas nuda]|uniref:Tyrocidine synthase 3 n=1 Tax=Pirellulimonas nuda TaxID=2528009 RepID=A0A518DJC6_9BACT|nr:non-ribosomal peptide synthetase [Pirellulimonas nuda]QDU91542.1 Tyrocidine synthase 3 [Pirellulimonas nuda]